MVITQNDMLLSMAKPKAKSRALNPLAQGLLKSASGAPRSKANKPIHAVPRLPRVLKKSPPIKGS